MKDQVIKGAELNFGVGGTDIMIPFKDLVTEHKHHGYKFNIKEALDDKHIILGEPIFRKYFIVLDYEHDRLGLSLHRTKFADKLIDVVLLIRFVVWVFLIGTFVVI